MPRQHNSMRRLAFIRTITHDLATKPVQISTIYGNLPNILDLVLKQSDRRGQQHQLKIMICIFAIA